MAFANNRAAARPRSTFRTAGGVIMKYRHPFLAGQISDASPIDEIDVSRAVKLNQNFLDAVLANPSSVQEVLVDGSVVTITNHLQNGKITMPVIATTGFVGTGDFIAALQLVVASKDDVGGTFTVKEFINGRCRVTVFYGVSVGDSLPILKIAGNSVVEYPVNLLFSGWVQGAGDTETLNEKTIWAVGSKYGLKAVYKPYAISESEDPNNFFGGHALSADDGVPADDADSNADDTDSVVMAADTTGMPADASRTDPDKFPESA